MSFSFSKIGTKLSIAKHLMSKESQLNDDPKSLAAILPLLAGVDDSTNYELTASGHGGSVGSLVLRSVGAIVSILLVLALVSTAHAGPFGLFSGRSQPSYAASPCANGQCGKAQPSTCPNGQCPFAQAATHVPAVAQQPAATQTQAVTLTQYSAPAAVAPPVKGEIDINIGPYGIKWKRATDWKWGDFRAKGKPARGPIRRLIFRR